jgi:hypothetical protein
MNNRQNRTDKIREWYNWLTTHVPSSIRKGVFNAFDTMRKKVVKLYNSSKEEEDQWCDANENFSDEGEKWYDVNPEEKLTPVLTKHGIKKKGTSTSSTPKVRTTQSTSWVSQKMRLRRS